MNFVGAAALFASSSTFCCVHSVLFHLLAEFLEVSQLLSLLLHRLLAGLLWLLGGTYGAGQWNNVCFVMHVNMLVSHCPTKSHKTPFWRVK